MNKTDVQYDEAVKQCIDIFLKKTKDYGTSWRVLRTISVVDQIFIGINSLLHLSYQLCFV